MDSDGPTVKCRTSASVVCCRRPFRCRRQRRLSCSWTSVVCFVCPAAVGLAVAVVTTEGVVGLVGCLSLLLTKSISVQPHFEQSSSVVSQSCLS